jgi:hypothetical protein
MHLPSPSLRRLVFVLISTLGTILPSYAFSTGVPTQFTVDPASVRELEKDESTVTATVTLQSPSPTYFVCQIRSSDRQKLSFTNIIFKKGQVEGTAPGTVHWLQVLKDTAVKVSAFSVDAPGNKLWFTVSLKLKDEDAPPAAVKAN